MITTKDHATLASNLRNYYEKITVEDQKIALATNLFNEKSVTTTKFIFRHSYG